jgi:hypothetical protein
LSTGSVKVPLASLYVSSTTMGKFLTTTAKKIEGAYLNPWSALRTLLSQF